MTEKQIRWGIIGPGKIANALAHDLQYVNDARLYAIASRDFDRAEQFRQRYNAEKAYGSYEALAADAAVDVVYIATPHPFHAELSLMCLEAGKAVLCEKPMGMSAVQVGQMIQKAKDKNVFLMEGIWTRFIPATAKLLELLEERAIGDVVSLHADFGFRAEWNPNGRLFNKALGGGALLDIGIYPLYLSVLTLGVPSNIKASGIITETGVDGYNATLLEYSLGKTAVLESTFLADTPIEAHFYGTDGHIKLHSRFHHATEISVFRKNERIQHFNLPYKGKGYVHEIEEVQRCVQNCRNESPLLPHAKSLQLATIMDEIRQQMGVSQ